MLHMHPTVRRAIRLPSLGWARPAALAIAMAAAAIAGRPASASLQSAQVAERDREVARQMALCPIKAEPASVDAGLVAPHSEVRFEATLRNPLDRPVTCIRSAPSCTCTTLDMVGKVIPAKGTLQVPISMKTSGATGEKTAAVVLTFADVPGLIELKLRAEVTYPVRGIQLNRGPDGTVRRDPFVNAFDIKENVRGTVTVESIDGAPFRVLSVDRKPPVPVPSAGATSAMPPDAPRESWTVGYDFTGLPCDRVPKYLVIETDRPDARLIDMRVRHECTRISPAFSFDQFRENVGVLAPGQSRTFELLVKRANGVRIDRVDSLEPMVTSRLIDQKMAGDELLVRVEVTAAPAAAGVFLGELRFTGVGPDPRSPVRPGQPAATAPRQSDFVIYGKVEAQAPAVPAPAAAAPPKDPPAASAPPAPGAPRAIVPLPVVLRIADAADQVPMDPTRFQAARQAVMDGLQWLRKAQGPDGGWLEGRATRATDQRQASWAVPAAVTGLAIKAFAQAGFPAGEDRSAARGLAFVTERTTVNNAFEPDPSGGLGTYVASALLQALAAQEDPQLVERIAAVRAWIERVQWDEGEGLASGSDWYGGFGYGSRGRPDLSNTQLVLDALHDAGASEGDPAVQRALAFVRRTQNVADNPEAWAQRGSRDGGFVYTPANGGESFASEAAGEGRQGEAMPEGTRSLRSYGSMTYAGFKSLLYAGLSADDPRVRAAWDWIRRHWGFAENPGLGQQGRYYYVHAAARALLASNATVVQPLDAQGNPSGAPANWRDALVDALLADRAADGSWANATERWMEGERELATIYAVLALEEALKPVTRSR